MENYHITETDLFAYLYDTNEIEATERITSLLSSNENANTNSSLIEIIEILWKTIL